MAKTTGSIPVGPTKYIKLLAINRLMYFAKLNKKIHIESYNEDSILSSYTVDGKGVIIYNISGYNESQILDLIPERYRKDFIIRAIKINRNIPPHTDSYTTVGINFYMQTSDCKTTFYEPADPAAGKRLTVQTTGRTFSEKDLQVHGSFVAENDDVYILDITKPHSVISSNPKAVDRIALTLQTERYSYEEVYNMLVETGYISELPELV